MNYETMSDKAVLGELGQRVQAQRLNVNMAQADVARKAGISRRALQNLESGRGCTLALLTRVLRVLGKLSQFEAFLPEPGPSPLQMAKLKGHERQRASGRRRRAGDKLPASHEMHAKADGKDGVAGDAVGSQAE